MNHEEKIRVNWYLKNVGVNTMEFYEEFYDHIITSFENRIDKKQTIDEHLNLVIQPSFGGVKGILRVMKAQQKTRQRMITKRFIAIFKEYLLGWPSIFITIVLFLLTYQMNQVFDPENVLIGFLAVGSLTPVIIAYLGHFKFRNRCKTQRRPYKSSDLNNRLLFFAGLGIFFLNIIFNFIGFMIWGSESNTFIVVAQLPFIQISLCVTYILFAMVIVRLLKEKFHLNILAI